jgi:hypothetical protein
MSDRLVQGVYKIENAQDFLRQYLSVGEGDIIVISEELIGGIQTVCPGCDSYILAANYIYVVAAHV